MRRRLTAWLVFLIFIGAVGVGAVTAAGHRIDTLFHAVIWTSLVAVSLGTIWQMRHGDARERQRAIDSRGIHVLPRGLASWLFDKKPRD